ncbi:MAG: hypothetical protein ACOC80_15195, partial [Petrotogales bacterium]
MIADYRTVNRCKNCILPEAYPNININGNVCSYCEKHEPVRTEGEESLQKLLDSYKSKDKKYDVLVPVSGGRDSTFTLYELVDKYDMKPLAYNYDSGLVSDEGKENLRNALETLDVDLVTVRHDQSKYFKNNLKALLKRFSPAMVPTLCLGCRYGIVGGAGKIAKKYNIPLIMFSSSRLEKSHFKNQFFKTNHKKRSLGMASEFTKNRSYFKPQFISMYFKDYFHDDSHVHPLSPVLKMLYGKLDIVEYFDFV